MPAQRLDTEARSRLPGFCVFMFVKDLFEDFIRDCRCNLMDGTTNEHSVIFKKVIIPSIGDKKLSDLLPIHRNDVLQKAKQFGSSMPRRAILTLRRLLHFTRACRIPTGIVADEIKIPPYYRKQDVSCWSRDEIAKIRAMLSTDFSSRFSKHARHHLVNKHKIAVKRTRALFELNLHSSSRLSEALSADRDRINWETKELSIQDCKPPYEWKTLFIHGAEEALKDYLACRTDSHPALFATSDGKKRLSRNGAQTTLKRLKNRVGKTDTLVRSINHKTCRSTHITTALKTVDPKKVQSWVHHKSLHTTLFYYQKILPQELKTAHQGVFMAL